MSETDRADPKFLRLGNPVAWGVGFSLLLLIALMWIFSMQTCVDGGCQTKWQKLLVSSPNEIGDTLAGVAGALAFLWIIVTVWLQSQELREQRKEMQLQREEMELQRKATEDMARSLAAQADIFEDEKKQRIETKSDANLNALLEEFSELWSAIDKRFFVWELYRSLNLKILVNGGLHIGATDRIHLLVVSYDSRADTDVDKFIKRNLKSILHNYGVIRQCIDRGEIKEYPSTTTRLKELAVPLFKIQEIALSCSDATQTRIRMMELLKLAELFEKLIADETLWGNAAAIETDSMQGAEP